MWQEWKGVEGGEDEPDFYSEAGDYGTEVTEQALAKAGKLGNRAYALHNVSACAYVCVCARARVHARVHASARTFM